VNSSLYFSMLYVYCLHEILSLKRHRMGGYRIRLCESDVASVTLKLSSTVLTEGHINRVGATHQTET
jgi:hypothetical protein